jgi:hypothetical protein
MPTSRLVARTLQMLLVATVACSITGAGRAEGATLDPRYVSALRCVDKFLYAWSNRDADRGLALVSAAGKAKYGAAAIRQFLIGTSSPNNAAFEVLDGKAQGTARYRFTVKLFYAITGGGLSLPTPQSIDAGATNVGACAIETLPK